SRYRPNEIIVLNDEESEETEYELNLNDNDNYLSSVDNSSDIDITTNKDIELKIVLEKAISFIEKSSALPQQEKWLDSVEKNFNPIKKMVEDLEKFENAKTARNTWNGRNSNTFYWQ
ncbi:6366_t:CDS:2, partial [Ambispora leptoticha]